MTMSEERKLINRFNEIIKSKSNVSERLEKLKEDIKESFDRRDVLATRMYNEINRYIWEECWGWKN